MNKSEKEFERMLDGLLVAQVTKKIVDQTKESAFNAYLKAKEVIPELMKGDDITIFEAGMVAALGTLISNIGIEKVIEALTGDVNVARN